MQCRGAAWALILHTITRRGHTAGTKRACARESPRPRLLRHAAEESAAGAAVSRPPGRSTPLRGAVAAAIDIICRQPAERHVREQHGVLLHLVRRRGRHGCVGGPFEAPLSSSHACPALPSAHSSGPLGSALRAFEHQVLAAEREGYPRGRRHVHARHAIGTPTSASPPRTRLVVKTPSPPPGASEARTSKGRKAVSSRSRARRADSAVGILARKAVATVRVRRGWGHWVCPRHTAITKLS